MSPLIIFCQCLCFTSSYFDILYFLTKFHTHDLQKAGKIQISVYTYRFLILYVFYLQKLCRECERYFCSNCVHRLSLKGQKRETFRQCKKCRMLLTGTFTRQELIKWKVKDLKCLLNKRSISTEGCKEKQELIDLIVINFGHMTRNDDIEERSVSKICK